MRCACELERHDFGIQKIRIHIPVKSLGNNSSRRYGRLKVPAGAAGRRHARGLLPTGKPSPSFYSPVTTRTHLVHINLVKCHTTRISPHIPLARLSPFTKRTS